MAHMTRSGGTLSLIAALAAAGALTFTAVYTVVQTGCTDQGEIVQRGSVLELVGGCVEHGDLPVGPQHPKNAGSEQAEGKHTPGKIRP
ncbi:hypothetical protein GCM10022247_19710 [Allokutzneria multivorans]|uniref:Uncharacterized protein n=2 Tax=Allokutzneria multivorans TaxID=1142134 RepID=A0ABP7RME8_9PSEU